jgi:hypothetical protein
MMQNREDDDRRSDVLAARPDPGFAGPGKNPLPTLALLLTGTIMLGAVGGWFLSSPSAPDAPVVAMLSPEQLADAMPTLNAGAQQTARSDSRECRFPFGFITVATPGNTAGGTVSFRTSKYQSPVFHVTDKPQQIAIPSPLPETGGVDLLSADGDAKGLLVSLYPTARMEPVNGTATVKVIWRPRPPCKS